MRVLMTLSYTSNMCSSMKTKDVLEWLGDVYSHEARNSTNSKRNASRKLLSWPCGGLNKLLEGGIGREANSRIGTLSHHLGQDQTVVSARRGSGRTTGNRPRYMPAIPSWRTMDMVPCTRPRYWGFGRLASSMSLVLGGGVGKQGGTNVTYALDRLRRGDSDNSLHHTGAQASLLHGEPRGQIYAGLY